MGLRARLLLDTLMDAAQGLRRELALPAVEGAPAEAVAAHLAEPGERTSTGHGSLAADERAKNRDTLPHACGTGRYASVRDMVDAERVSQRT